MPDLTFDEGEFERRVDGIVAFIEEQCAAAGVDGVVIGLSGGVDSATTAALAARAVGPDDVRALFLPAAPTSDRSVQLANAVADALGLELSEVTVEPIVEAVAGVHDGPVEQVPLGNVRARVRAVYWYLVANQEDRLVVGGGNRTEWLTGYFTKYGDIAVDCLPLGNLYKAQVRQVAARLGVPQEVIERAPSAELWPDQTDESELAIAYETLDAILALYIDGTHSREETADQLDIEPSVIDRIDRLVVESRHKRRLPPTPDTTHA